ncbi:MAG: hypothetical protein WCV59_05500 [Parcubacteria group bacterium]|jgi:hypothetical protein
MKRVLLFVLLVLAIVFLVYIDHNDKDEAVCFTRDGFAIVASSSDSKIKEIFSDWKKEDAEAVDVGNVDAFVVVARGKITVSLTRGFRDPADGLIVKGFNISYEASLSDIKDSLFKYLFKQRGERIQEEQEEREKPYRDPYPWNEKKPREV